MISLALASFLTLAQAGAMTACGESATNVEDGACVLQVVRNRWRVWRRSGRYRGKTLYEVLMMPGQHAHSCRIGLRPQHLRLGMLFALDKLEVPQFCKQALYYCGDYDRRSCLSRPNTIPAGKIWHTFLAPR